MRIFVHGCHGCTRLAEPCDGEATWPTGCNCFSMSTRYNDGSHYENHQRAAELEDVAKHVHDVGELHGQGEHLTPSEQSRNTHMHPVHETPSSVGPSVGHGVASFSHRDIEALAYEIWQERGCPQGSPEEDWFHAAKQLRSRVESK